MNAKLITAGALLGGGVGGLLLGREVTQSAYLNDMRADPNQVIHEEGDIVVQRPRPHIGPLMMLGSMMIGGLVAAGGAAWTMHAASQAKAAAGMMGFATRVGSFGAFGVGAGIVAGGVATSMLFQNAYPAVRRS